jgi:hypothetical protein
MKRSLLSLCLGTMLVGLQPMMASAYEHERYGYTPRSNYGPRADYPPYDPYSGRRATIGVPSLTPSYADPHVHYPTTVQRPESAAAHIREWYVKYLGRHATPQEIDHWLDFVYRRSTLAEVQIGIMAAPECFQRCHNDPRVYVDFLFTQITGRQPTPREVQYWVSLLHDRFQGERRDFCRALINAIG